MNVIVTGAIMFTLSFILWNGYPDKTRATHLACGMTLGILITGGGMLFQLLMTSETVWIPVLLLTGLTLVLWVCVSLPAYLRLKESRLPGLLKDWFFIFSLPPMLISIGSIFFSEPGVGVWITTWSVWFGFLTWVIKSGFWDANPTHLHKENT